MKIGDKTNPRAQPSDSRAARARGLLLAASLSLVGCSLSIPKEGELFAPVSSNDDPSQLDGATPASERDGAVTDRDSGRVPDAENGGSDAASNGELPDAGGLADAGSDAGPASFDPQTGLVVHYRFNETTGNTVNDFAGDKDAVIVGTPSGFSQWESAGHSDGALRLAGVTPTSGPGHSVEVPQGVLLGLTQCSISLWLNRSGGPMWQRVFDFGSGEPVWLYLTAQGGTGLPIVAGRTPALIFVDYKAIVDAPAGEGTLKIMQPIPVSTWQHFVLTWSISEMKVYLNGKLVAQAVTYGQVAPTDLGNTAQNYLGRSQYPNDPYFNGLLDDFRIYDRVLSASDVAQLYEVK